MNCLNGVIEGNIQGSITGVIKGDRSLDPTP